ncbi:MAG: class I SAM-dependent methyltransferase [Burkholderiales bacterium]
MHPSAVSNGRAFFETYADDILEGRVIDIGAQNVNGSLKDLCPGHLVYTGVDFVAGKGVDVVLDDPYVLPFEDGSIEVVLSSSVFEHVELFWVLFLEIMRVLKPQGLFYMNAPSAGLFHRYPVDCWRFYPDSGNALLKWAHRNNYDPVLLESFIARQENDMYNDFVAVYLKDKTQLSRYKDRILDAKQDFTNGVKTDEKGVQTAFLNQNAQPEDLEKLNLIRGVLAGSVKMKK